jgi:hypothetical protein
VERELERITAEVNAWRQGRGYDQDSPEAYIAAVEERKAKARTHKRLAAGGPAGAAARAPTESSSATAMDDSPPRYGSRRSRP